VAAVYSAINVNLVKIATYSLMGLLAGVAGLLQASRLNSVSSSSTGMLSAAVAFAAVAVGGTSLRGGSGTVWGTVVGVMLLGVTGNMLNMLNINPYLQGAVKGAILIGAVLLQRGRSGD
jgi:ribose transport system permease protein